MATGAPPSWRSYRQPGFSRYCKIPPQISPPPRPPLIDHTIVEEIVSTVVDQGSLTKEQICETWGLGSDDYNGLKHRVANDPRVEPGPRRTGGFIAVARRRRTDPTEQIPILGIRTDWEQVAVDRLCELLKADELEKLIGNLESTLRNTRRILTGKDRPSRKEELAVALVLQRGVDLFSNTDVRRAVGHAARVTVPERWHPGKGAAAEFVVAARFPIEFAGTPSAESLPDMEYLEGRFRLRELEPFQKEVQRELLSNLYELGRRCIVTLPTGAGKTRVAVESISYWMFDRYDRENDRARQGTVLWLAHTEELCEQACACFKQVWEGSENVCPMTLVRFWANYTGDLVEQHLALREVLRRPGVLVSTPQRMANLLDGRTKGAEHVLNDFLPALGLIVIDEAHRAAAPSYRRILDALVNDERRVSVFGLTATPFRAEYIGRDPEEGTRDLKEIFGRLVEPFNTLGENPRVALQELEVLARPVFETIETDTAIRIPDSPESLLLSEEEMERIDRVLALRTDNSPRRIKILEQLLPIAQNPFNSVLYFGPSVRDAEAMAYLLRERGIPSAVLSGTTRDVTRRQVINEFKNGQIRVLCNCEVLTTGFDAPKVTHVVIARPTVSRVLYEQIVGRGLRGRKFGGTDTCVIIDCQDDYRGNRPPLGYETFRKIWYEGLGTEPRPFGPRTTDVDEGVVFHD